MSSSLDAEIMEAIRQISPSTAYLCGFNEYAGKLFVPSETNIRAALAKVRGLRRRAETELQRKVLLSVETAMKFEEPQPVLDEIAGTIFAHLLKEGVNDEHMISLLKSASEAIEASKQRFRGKDVPVGVKALTLYRLSFVIDTLETVRKESKSREVKAACQDLKEKTAEYVGLFTVEGFGRGEFANIEKLFKKHGFSLGRERFYVEALKNAFDYDETPEELEAMAMGWIDEELPRFRRATEKLAKIFHCAAVPEEIEKAINGRMKLDPKELIGVTMAIRKVVERFINEDVAEVNPKYKTKVIDTPSYLTGTIPTGAAQFYDTYTKNPFQVFFQTTDPKRDPDKSVSGLLNLLVHEEYGHCLNHSNSALGFAGKLNPIQLFPGAPTSAPITEGLSFNREIEFCEASKALEKKKRLSKAERDYVNLMDKYGGLKQINLEEEFWTRRWRIVRFLRVVGDVRVNTGKQGLLEFVDWASAYTGVPRSSVFFQLFPAHEGIFPGYATTYAVVGQEIRAIEKKIKDDRKRVKFSTYLCSIGFPPRSIYRMMLRDYAKKLK